MHEENMCETSIFRGLAVWASIIVALTSLFCTLLVRLDIYYDIYSPESIRFLLRIAIFAPILGVLVALIHLVLGPRRLLGIIGLLANVLVFLGEVFGVLLPVE